MKEVSENPLPDCGTFAHAFGIAAPTLVTPDVREMLSQKSPQNCLQN
jgi:hypothetical protein